MRPAHTPASDRHWWLRAAVFGFAYFAVGMVFGTLAGSTVSEQTRVIWRLVAWAASGLLYLAHIAYEHFRLCNSPRSIALHAASGTALGAFGLAFAATIHSLMTSHYRPAYLIALVAWPAITSFPALLVALAVTAGLARFARR